MQEDTLPAVQAVPEGARAITKYTAEHGREVGLPSPEAVNYMASIANMLADSALVTKDVIPEGVHPDARGPIIKANMMAKMLVGHELGIPAIQALQDVFIVKGRIFVGYPQLYSQIEGKGYSIETLERSHERAAIRLKKEGRVDQDFEFTFEDAERAGLTAKSQRGEDMQYQKRARVMLWARCVSEAYRATGGQGNVYTNEERKEIEDSDRNRGDGSTDVFASAGKERANPYPVGETAAKVTAAVATPPPPVAAEPTKPDTVVDVKAEQEATPPTVVTGIHVMPSREAPPPAATEVPTAEKPADPEAVAPDKPAPAEKTKSPLEQKFYELSDLTPKLSPPAAIKQFKEWLCGFFSVAKVNALPVGAIHYEKPLALLEASLQADAALVLQDARTSGLLTGTGWRTLLKAMDAWKWSDLVKERVVSVICAMGQSANPQETRDWFTFLGLPGLEDVDIDIFMQLAVKAKGTAHKILGLCKLDGMRPRDIVARWAIDLDTVPAEGLVILLNNPLPKPGSMSAPAETPPPPPSAEPKAAVDTVDADEDFDLFGLVDGAK